jgi:hypothetical protein
MKLNEQTEKIKIRGIIGEYKNKKSTRLEPTRGTRS